MHPDPGETNKRLASPLAGWEARLELADLQDIAARFYPARISWTLTSVRVMSCWGSELVGIQQDLAAGGSILGLPKVPSL
jgi:hypothetical protein